MTQTPAGWYADPERPDSQRYWDGANWTEHRAPAAQVPATPGAPGAGTQPAKKKGLGTGAIVAIVLGVVVVVLGGVIAVAIVLGSAGKSIINAANKTVVDRSVISDVTNASLSMESYYSTNNDYPTTLAAATAASNANPIIVSSGVHLTVTGDGTTGYCIAGWAPGSSYTQTSPKLYDSNKGGLQADGASCSTTYANTFTLQ